MASTRPSSRHELDGPVSEVADCDHCRRRGVFGDKAMELGIKLIGDTNGLAQLGLLAKGSLLALLHRHGRADALFALLRLCALRSQALVVGGWG